MGTEAQTPYQEAYAAITNMLANPLVDQFLSLRDKLKAAADAETFLTVGVAQKKAAIDAEIGAKQAQLDKLTAAHHAAMDDYAHQESMAQQKVEQAGTQAVAALEHKLSVLQESYDAKLTDLNDQVVATQAQLDTLLLTLNQQKKQLLQTQADLADITAKKQALLEALNAPAHP